MSLKLDELRKRLLQQQSGSEGGAPEPSPRAGNSKVLGPRQLKIVEAAAPKAPAPPPTVEASEPPTVTKDRDALAENKQPVPEPSGVSVAPELPETNVSDANERVSSFKSGPVPEAPRSLGGQTVAAVSVTALPEPAVQHELAEAVGKVFEQTTTLKARLEDLSRIFEPIDRMGNSAARAFVPLRGFQKQIAQLARSFEPMRTFRNQLSQLAQTFEPMKALEDQLAQLADSFQTHLGDLIKALEPAKQIRERIEQLGAAFEQATELQEQFTELYDAFRLSPPSNGNGKSLDAQSNAAR